MQFPAIQKSRWYTSSAARFIFYSETGILLPISHDYNRFQVLQSQIYCPCTDWPFHKMMCIYTMNKATPAQAGTCALASRYHFLSHLFGNDTLENQLIKFELLTQSILRFPAPALDPPVRLGLTSTVAEVVIYTFAWKRFKFSYLSYHNVFLCHMSSKIAISDYKSESAYSPIVSAVLKFSQPREFCPLYSHMSVSYGIRSLSSPSQFWLPHSIPIWWYISAPVFQYSNRQA